MAKDIFCESYWVKIYILRHVDSPNYVVPRIRCVSREHSLYRIYVMWRRYQLHIVWVVEPPKDPVAEIGKFRRSVGLEV